MSKDFEKFLTYANKHLKERYSFRTYEITVDGDFSSEYNFVDLSNDRHHFPIATVATEGEAVAAIKGYMTGLGHGKENSYPHFCDKQ